MEHVRQICKRTREDDKEEDINAVIAKLPRGKGGYSLRKYDLSCLNDREYINDNIVNFVINWAKENIIPNNYRNNIRIVDALWPTLIVQGVDPTIGDVKKSLMAKLEQHQRWFPNGHPFDHPIVVIPICQRAHWILAVMYQHATRVTIVMLDSLHSNISVVMAAYIKILVEICLPDAKVNNIRPKITQQTNGHDCGLHTITNAIKAMLWAGAEIGGLAEYFQTESRIVTRAGLIQLIKSAQEERPAEGGIMQINNAERETEPSLPLNNEEEAINAENKNEFLMEANKQYWLGNNVCLHNTLEESIQVKEANIQKILEWALEEKQKMANKNGRKAVFTRYTENFKLRFRIKESIKSIKVLISRK